MRFFLSAIFCVVTLASYCQQTAYKGAWQELNSNKWASAAKLLTDAEADPLTFQDAYITNIYLKTYNGKIDNVTDFGTSYYDKSQNPYPYIYALWYNTAVLGESGKKDKDYQLKLVDRLITDKKAHGTIVGSANYQRGMNNLFSNNFDKTQPYFDAVGNIKNWQYAGPFENISESGFYKNYGPLEHPEPEAIFKSVNNADVKWITPAAENKDGWNPVCYQFNKSTGVAYAQNFVQSPSDQQVYCNIGVSGSIKVWINDELMIAESKERVTDMDTYTVKCNLKKGANRVLIQIGYTATSYPNFNVRFTDENFWPLQNITGSSTFAAYSKTAGDYKSIVRIAHFAEAFFADKIAKQPENLVNYLLLADVYLRNKKIIEARDILTTAINMAPDNCLLKTKMVEVLIREDNRTLMLEEIEKIKQADPNSLLVYDLKLKELFENQKFEDGAIELKKRIDLYGEDQATDAYKILLLANDKKYDELVKEAEKIYKKYPGNAKLLEMMYAIRKEVDKDDDAALKVYQDYMKNNFNYETVQAYASLLEDRGKNSKALEIKKKLADLFPYDPSGYYRMAQYYYTAKDYSNAENYINKSLALAPYNEVYWEQYGDIKNEQKKTTEALEAYTRSLKYAPNQYSLIGKIRKLNGQPELNKVFDNNDMELVIKQDKQAEAKNTDYGYYYILDEKNVIIYPDGANEEYSSLAIRITNQKGVDSYKESSISYGSSQSLLIEKSEVYKPSGAKIQGERNDNEIVFSNLEIGDVVVFKYRKQNFVSGRFAKEFTDNYFFNGQIYTAITRYSLLAPASLKLNFKNSNFNLQPVVKDVEDFKQYTWELKNAEPFKNEPKMPLLIDICPGVHISTMSSWKDISDWYSDVTNNNAETDFEIVELYKKLFPADTKSATQFQKARIIYDYIEDNISYSYVSFRQSAFVPQRPSATLTTRLGDCKDLSSLFVTLARMAGIQAQMVLVNTRDNGENAMVLPSMDFNHCIAKVKLDNKDYYIELTDKYLPFTSLPNNVIAAAILEIPSKTNNDIVELKQLKGTNRTKDKIKRVIDIKPVESDLEISVTTIMYGNPSSSIRNNYKSMDNENQLLEMEKVVAGRYKNIIKMSKINFAGLNKAEDSISYNYDYKAKNEVAEIGSIQTFKIIYPDIVASLDNFSADSRLYPFEYRNYEDIDEYETIVNITAPAGKKFIELPVTETYTFKDMKFSIQYISKGPGKLMVIRKFSNGRQNVSAEDYIAFKTFFEKIVKAEQKFIAYK